MTIRAFAVVCVLVVISILAISTLAHKIRVQETAIAALQQEKETFQRLNDENERVKSASVDPAEVERLRRETAILLKLRNEVGMYERSSTEPLEVPSAKAEVVARLLNEREQIVAEERQIRKLSDR